MTPPARRWHEQAASVGSLIVAVVVMLAGAVASVVSVAVANEARFSANERQAAIMAYQLDQLQKANVAQDDRMNRREAENRAALDQIVRTLGEIKSSLAVHEAKGGIGLTLRAPVSGK